MPGSYAEMYSRSMRDPCAFWMAAAKELDWYEPPTVAFDSEGGVHGRWFPDGVCNACHNALDRHVAAGRGAQL